MHKSSKLNIIGVFGFHYVWFVKTAAAIDSLCVSLFMLKCKQCFQLTAIYSVCYISRIKYNIPFSCECS